MKLFNRNDDKEKIDNAIEKIDELETQMQNLMKENKAKEDKIKKLEDEQKKLKGKYDKLFKEMEGEVENQFLNLYDRIAKYEISDTENKEKIDKIEKSLGKYNELVSINADYISIVSDKLDEIERKFEAYDKIIEDLSKAKEDKEKTVEKNEKKHLYKVPTRVAIPYTYVKLQGNYLWSVKRRFSFNIDAVISIKNNIEKYYNEKLSLRAIAHKHGISYDVIYRLVWNIEEGVFDEVIQQYKEENPQPKTGAKAPTQVKEAQRKPAPKKEGSKIHYRHVAKSQRKPLKINSIRYDAEGELYSNNRKLQYNINDIKKLKERIPNFEEYPSKTSLLADMKIGDYGGNILIWRIEEGLFDKLLEDFDNNQKNKDIIEDSTYHIFNLSKSYHIPFDNLKVGYGGELYSSNNQRLSFTIQDVIELKKRIYSNRFKITSELQERFTFSRQLCNKLIWNIEEGNFDELIDEYNSRNYTYENKINRLYIDGEDTGLTIEKCNLIIDCLVNDGNKQGAINRLIKNYPTTKPKYIRILGEEYNNINLMKVLKKQVKKVEKENNPQKRREQGVYSV